MAAAVFTPNILKGDSDPKSPRELNLEAQQALANVDEAVSS